MSVRILSCELCGSTNVVRQNGIFVCQHCQTKYSVEDAKKMMLGDIPAKESAENAAAFPLEKNLQRAEKMLELGKFTDSYNMFTEISKQHPDDYRGWWGIARACSNNLVSSPDDPFLVSGDIPLTDQYITNKVFAESWAAALNTVEDNKIHDDIQKKGLAYIREHKRDNCSKAIMNLLKMNGFKKLSDVQNEMPRMQSAITANTVTTILFIICAIIFFILTIFNSSNLFIFLFFWAPVTAGFAIFASQAHKRIKRAKRRRLELTALEARIQIHMTNLHKI